MSTYPLIIRLADGTETTEVFENYRPDMTDACAAAKDDPRVREIEGRRVKDGDERQMVLWTRDPANGNWIG